MPAHTIYRQCSCGETAFTMRLDIPGTRSWVWKCRNCRAFAKDRKGQVKNQAGCCGCTYLVPCLAHVTERSELDLNAARAAGFGH